jgi:hypothetical protein
MSRRIAGKCAATSDTQNEARDSMADALYTLTDQTQKLATSEIRSAILETWQKATTSAPALGLPAASGGCALLAVASCYRLSLGLLEKRLSPVSSAAAVMYGGAAAAAAAEEAGTQRPA